MADKNIAIILTTDNKTKAGFSAVVKSIKDLETATVKTTKGTKGLNTSLGKLVAGFTLAGIATKVVTESVRLLTNEFNASIQAANQYALSMAGLSSTAAAFGESQDEARKSAIALTEDGLITVTTAAQGLRALMATGLEMDKAVELMGAYKDEAAFGRANTITFDQAVGNLAESFMTESSMIGNLSGQTENYNIILKAGASQLGKTVNELTGAERVQAKYLGTLIVASKASGDAARVANTFAGSQSRLTTATFNLRAAIGTALLPALTYTNDSFTNLLNAMRPTPEMMVRIGQTALRVAGAIRNFAVAVSALSTAWLQFRLGGGIKRSFETISGGVKNIQANLIDTGERMMAVTKDQMSNISNFSKDTAQKLTDFADNAATKAADLAKKVANEIRDYGRDLAKMISNFTESLSDLVFAHRSKRRQLENDITSENKTFEKKNKERQEDFDESMTTAEDRHTEKVASIKSDIEDELEAVRLAENQREAFQDDKYLVDINRHKKKVADLKASLEKENNEHAKQTQKLKTELDKQTSDATEQHKDKLMLLQAELAIELEIEKKHIEDFDRLKEQQKEDDITRLKRKHAEEKAERERDHNEKIAELYSQGASEKASYDKGREGASQEQARQAVAQAGADKLAVPTVITPMFPLENLGVGTAGASATMREGTNFFSDIASGISSAVSNVWSGITGFFSNLPFFQEGGVVPGQPNEAQLAVVHGQETITPAGQSVGGNVVLNVNIGTLVNSRIERRNFAEQVWLEIGEIAKSQNRSPQELLSI